MKNQSLSFNMRGILLLNSKKVTPPVNNLSQWYPDVHVTLSRL